MGCKTGLACACKLQTRQCKSFTLTKLTAPDFTQSVCLREPQARQNTSPQQRMKAKRAGRIIENALAKCAAAERALRLQLVLRDAAAAQKQ
jgi:hypothetical protein